MKQNNIAYWILHNQQNCHNDFPQSDIWTNDLYFAFDNASSIKSCIEMVSENISKEKPTHYAIITDAECNEMCMFHENFISNNIICIGEKYDKEKVGKQIEWIISDFGINRIKPEEKIWFISDTHFFHKNIIKYCNRPWNSGKDSEGNLIVTDNDVDRMNKFMIEEWNSFVSKSDIVFHLGDFSLGDRSRIPELRKQLNGKISLILGNHDWFHIKDKEKHKSVIDFFYDAGFEKVYDKPIIFNDFIVLSHMPMSFVKAPFYNIFGHVHDCSTYNTWSKDSCCACVERHDYRPVSFDDVKLHYEELNSQD